MTHSTSAAKKVLKNILAFAFWIAVWQLAALKAGQELILPAPMTVLSTLLSLGAEPAFWASAGYSLLRVFGGFSAGIVLGTLLAAATSFSTVADALFSPMIRIIRATPVASFIILALLWIGKAWVPCFISMLMVLPVVWGNVCSAISQTDKTLLEMAKLYRFGKGKTLRYIFLPSVYPSWRAGCITALGLAWKAGVAAEVLCLPKLSIGTELYYSKIYLETPSLFAWTVVVILLSFLVEKGFVALMKRRSGL